MRDPRRLRLGLPLNLPVHLLKTEPEQAQVSHFRGQITIDVGTGARPPRTNQSLGEGSIISTGANAFVRLGLSDGSHVVVPSNSRVRLKRLRRFVINGAVDHEIEVLRGRLESRVTPRQSPGGYRVTTPVSVSAVRGTEFRLSLNEAGDRTSTEVLEGRVEVDQIGTDDSAEAKANEALTVGSSGLSLASLLPPPSLVDPKAILTESEAKLGIMALPGAVAYRGRLALDAGMVEAVAETDSQPGDRALNFGDLEDGHYFLRLTALSPEGVEGRGRVYNLVRISNPLSGLSAQGLGDPNQRAYRFRWEADVSGIKDNDAPIHYRFVLYRQGANGEPDGPPLFDRPALYESNLSLTGLSQGTYLWRVQANQSRYGVLVADWSEFQALHIGQ